jgi:hypothetical protein
MRPGEGRDKHDRVLGRSSANRQGMEEAAMAPELGRVEFSCLEHGLNEPSELAAAKSQSRKLAVGSII